MTIELLNESHLTEYIAYLRRIFHESGRDGWPVFTVSTPECPRDVPLERIEKFRKSWANPVGTLPWCRAWAFVEGSQIVGSLDLQSHDSQFSQHRTIMGMALMRDYTGQSKIDELWKEALQWLRQHPQIEWVDCNVFENNPRSQKKVKSWGFEEIGRKVDAYRVGNFVGTDIVYALKLRPER